MKISAISNVCLKVSFNLKILADFRTLLKWVVLKWSAYIRAALIMGAMASMILLRKKIILVTTFFIITVSYLSNKSFDECP